MKSFDTPIIKKPDLIDIFITLFITHAIFLLGLALDSHFPKFGDSIIIITSFSAIILDYSILGGSLMWKVAYYAFFPVSILVRVVNAVLK